MIIAFIALAAAGCAFFALRWFQLAKAKRGLTQIENMQLVLEEARALEARRSWKERLSAELVRNGYRGDLFPFFAAVGFLYLSVVVALRLFGVSNLAGALTAIPASGFAVWSGAQVVATRRRRRFNHQLLQLLQLVAGQIEGGVGSQKAIAAVVPNMQEPLKGEMSAVLDAQLVTKDLIGGIRTLSLRYPSRALDMFISALEIDRAEGHAIGPALHQAAAILNRDFELSAEARAEVSQTKAEFLAVFGILGVICARMLFSGDPATHDAYFSAIGLVVLLAAASNVALGIFRALRLLNRARGDV